MNAVQIAKVVDGKRLPGITERDCNRNKMIVQLCYKVKSEQNKYLNCCFGI